MDSTSTSTISRRTMLRAAGISTLAVAGLATSGPVSASPRPQFELPEPKAPISPEIPSRRVAAREFGAVPDTGADQTAALQAAIDHVAADGGGTVELDSGTYGVSIQPNGSALVLRSRVGLAARRSGHTTIRIADQQGDYFAILSTFDWDNETEDLPFNDPVHDIAIDGIRFDMNATHNPIHADGLPFGLRNHQRAAVWVNQTFRLAVRHCAFVDSVSIQVILVDPPGESADVLIEHCSFTGVGGSDRHYDHSTIYLQGHRMSTRHCTFRTRNGAGTNGVVAAIEVHGDDMSVTHNDINGYYVALNIVGGNRQDLSNVQYYADNRMTEVAMGGTLWHGNFQDEPYTLQNVIITRNVVDITGRWAESAAPAPTQYYGFATRYAPIAGIRGLSITHNRITFADMDPLLNDRTWWKDSMAGGIVFHRIDSAPYRVVDFEVCHNQVTSPPSAGIWSNIALENGTIRHNLVRNPGTNGVFDPPKEYPAQWPSYRDEYRTAVSLNGPTTNVDVADNVELP